MTSMPTFSDLIASGSANTNEALALFDSLDTIDLNFMIGRWRGAGFPTGHRLDGLLEAYHWYGKHFISPDHVHPLIFTNLGGTRSIVNPALIPIRLSSRIRFPQATIVGRLFQLCLPLMSTKRSRARLRMTNYRGKVSATMIYDDLPINDAFRLVDTNTVLGVMDLKGMEQPFFFVLNRET
jgi:hypothetical protein